MSDSRSRFFLSHGVDANLAHCRKRVLSNVRKNSLCVSNSWALSESSALKGHFIRSQKDHCDLRMLDLKGTREIACIFLSLEVSKVETRRLV